MTSRREVTLSDVVTDLDRLLTPTTVQGETRTLMSHALVHLFAANPAFPGAASYDSDKVSGSSSSGPPRGFDQPDPSAADRKLLDELLRRLRSDSDALFRLVERWQLHYATPKDRALAALNEATEPGCESCRTVGHWSRVHVQSSDVKGTLEAPMMLCASCYRHVLNHGCLPTRKQLESLRDKGSWRESA